MSLTKKLQQYTDNTKNLNGTTFTYNELFNDQFMVDHTNFHTFSDMLTSANLNLDNIQLDDFHTESFNNFIQKNTKFNSFDEMKRYAVNIIVKKHIFK